MNVVSIPERTFKKGGTKQDIQVIDDEGGSNEKNMGGPELMFSASLVDDHTGLGGSKKKKKKKKKK